MNKKCTRIIGPFRNITIDFGSLKGVDVRVQSFKKVNDPVQG